MNDYVLTSEAARLLKRSPDAVRAMERTGRLPAVRVGHVRLFRRRTVERLVAEREKQAKAATPVVR